MLFAKSGDDVGINLKLGLIILHKLLWNNHNSILKSNLWTGFPRKFNTTVEGSKDGDDVKFGASVFSPYRYWYFGNLLSGLFSIRALACKQWNLVHFNSTQAFSMISSGLYTKLSVIHLTHPMGFYCSDLSAFKKGKNTKLATFL